MSVKRLSRALHDLQTTDTIGADDVHALREAAGPKVSTAEAALLDSFALHHSPAFTSEASDAFRDTFAMEVPQGVTMEICGTQPLPVMEASGVVPLPGTNGSFLVADDEKGIFRCDADGTTQLLRSSKKHKELKGLEGLCLSSDGASVYALSENTGQIVSLKLKGSGEEFALGKPKALGTLPALGDEANKGWEGLDILPAHLSPTGADQLVAVHEGHPRRVGVFSLPDLTPTATLSLPDALDAEMPDLSDIAVHPTTGHLFLLSDEGACVAETQLVTTHQAGPGGLLATPQLKALALHDLPQEKGRKAEGLCFTDAHTLWIACEGKQDLLQVRLSSG